MSRQLQREITYTECKTFGHGWELFTPLDVQYHTERGEHRFSLRCGGCATVRHDFFNRVTGEMVGRYYEYRDDYKQVGVKLTKDELRIAVMKGGGHVRLRVVS